MIDTCFTCRGWICYASKHTLGAVLGTLVSLLQAIQRDALIPYMHVNLSWFYGLKPTIYDTPILNKCVKMKYLTQAVFALKI